MIPGTTTIGSVGVRRTVADLMQDAHATTPATRLPEPTAVNRVSQPTGAQSVSTGFTTATLKSSHPTPFATPDPMGAVGPKQFVTLVNGRLDTFDKSGVADGVLDLSPINFFAGISQASQVFYPRIRYDRPTARWILLMVTNTTTNRRVVIAVSDAASAGVITASTVFTFFSFQPFALAPSLSSNCVLDYPSLGVDANALYIGGNEYCGANNATFGGSDGFVVRKSSILGAGPIVVTAFRGLVNAASPVAGPFAPQGVDNDDPAATEGYFIGADVGSSTQLTMRRVLDPAGTPTISSDIAVAIPPTTYALDVNQLGNISGANGKLFVSDDRLISARIRGGRLWTSHSIGVDNTGVSTGTVTRDGARWYELAVPTGGTPTLVQSGTVFTPSATNSTDQRNYWMPSIMVSGQGHAAMSMGAAGTLEYANAAVVGRLRGDAPGTMQTPALVTNSNSVYRLTASTADQSWGYYTYTSLDPLDDMTMWTISQYCDSATSYAIRVTKLLAPPPASPWSLPDIAAGSGPQHVTLVGASARGAGFFDPGADLPGVPTYKHLTASILAGSATGTPPVLVSAKYLDPLTLDLVIDATSATENIGSQHYTVRVVNPDGQSASAAVLRVGKPGITAIAGSGDLSAAQAFATGATPQSVALGDLNGDGKLDAVTANFGAGTVSVLLGDGAGGFGAKTDIVAGNNPYAVELADLNADQKLDLIVTNNTASTVSVMLGNGSGGFGTRTAFGTGGGPISIVVADVNNDGAPDLVVLDNGTSEFYVLLGSNTGNFTPYSSDPCGPAPYAMVLGDFDRDGRLDAAVCNVPNSTVSVLLGDGGGGFGARTTFATGLNPKAIATADVNGDGLLDIVTANYNAGTVSVLLGDGAGGFAAATTWAVGNLPTSVRLADFDADGHLDIITGSSTLSTVSVLLGNGTGTFAAKRDFASAANPNGIAIADLDGNGTADVVTANPTANTISVLRGLGGSVTPNGLARYAYGATPGYTFAAAPGYYVANVQRDGTPLGSLPGYAFPSLAVSHTLGVTFHTGTLGVGDPGPGDAAFATPLVYPNPSHGTPVLAYTLRAPGALRAGIFDLNGRMVREVHHASDAHPGTYRWPLSDAKNAPLAAGLYFYRIESASGVANGRFVVIE
jgi:hypothetical protein